MRIYPLAGLTYCAHCEKIAQEQNNVHLRTRLSGANQRGSIRYRHKPGVQCGVTNRSTPADAFEDDFRKLLRLLTMKPEALDLMLEFAILMDKDLAQSKSEQEDMQKKKDAAIAKARRRIEAARLLFLDGEMTREEYLRRKEANEREIAHWEARTGESEKLAMELALCLDTVSRLVDVWDGADDELKKRMAGRLFEEIVYDLDTRRIVSFQLKPWADRFLMLRTSLYVEVAGEIEDQAAKVSGEDDEHTDVRSSLLRGI